LLASEDIKSSEKSQRRRRDRGEALSPTVSEWSALRAGKITDMLTIPDRG
jgi:hypothetical protein